MTMIEDRHKYGRNILMGISIGLLLSMFFLLGVGSNMQDRLHDPVYGKAIRNDIVILAVDDKSLQEVGRWPWDRKVFAELISRLENASVIGIDVMFSEKSNDLSDQLLASAIIKNRNVVLPIEFTAFSEGEKISDTSMLKPLDIFEGANGIVNIVTDADGVSRSVNTDLSHEFPIFAAVIASKIKQVTVPISDRLLINMRGGAGTFTAISSTDVLHDRVDFSQFNQKIILIGATATDLHDNYFVQTSHGVPVPGVEIHANTVDMILANDYLSVVPWWVTVLLIIGAAVGIALLLSRFSPWMAAACGFCMLIGYLFVVIMLFEKGMVLDLLYFPVTIVCSYGTVLGHNLRMERREKKQVLDAFSKYVSPKVIRELFLHPEKLSLGGEKKVITIFFSDIRGFTTISEKLSPEALVDLLNEYLTAMTDLIIESDGVIDKYMGDAIMAFWGAPLDQPDHSDRACRTALKMMAQLKIMQKKWSKDGVPPLDIGIGLNTGPAVVGNMGSTQRFDYTCMGDTINLGSRLEGINKEYGTHIIISESTRAHIGDSFVVRELDAVKVKGKNDPIHIFELVGDPVDVTEDCHRMIAFFNAGIEKYRKQNFKAAIVEFKNASKMYNDKTSLIYIERCMYFLEHPPGKSWDGVWVMKTK